MTDIIKVEAWRNKKYPNMVEFSCPMGCMHKRKRKIHQHCSPVEDNEMTIQRSPHCDQHILNENDNYEFELII